MTRRKRIILLWMMGLLLALAVPVSGAEQTGSIRVAADRMMLYRVGDGSGTLCPAFADCGADLTDWSQPDTAQRLADFVRAHDLPGVSGYADGTGKVIFADLSPGIYLLVHPADRIRPFLVPLPLTAGNTVCYEIDAAPKTAPDHPDTGQATRLLPWLALSAAALLAAAALVWSKNSVDR